MEMNTTGASGVPQMVFVDDEGLEEQFLTEDEDTPNILDTTVNHVTTPVDTFPENQGTQQAQEEELDLQPSRGPREESLVNTIDQFLDENYEDVLRTSNIQTNFSLSASNRNLTGLPVLPLGWIVSRWYKLNIWRKSRIRRFQMIAHQGEVKQGL